MKCECCRHVIPDNAFPWILELYGSARFWLCSLACLAAWSRMAVIDLDSFSAPNERNTL